MRYIDHILQPGEKVMYSTTIHWIVYRPGIAMLAILARRIRSLLLLVNGPRG